MKLLFNKITNETLTSRQPSNAGGFPGYPASPAGGRQAGGGWQSPCLLMIEVSKDKNK